MALQTTNARQHLHLSIDPAPYAIDNPPPSLSPDSPSPSSSQRSTAGTTPTSDTSSASIMYSVLCLHDFSSDDPDHLPFSKNELLEIVKEEDSGWWAAMRIGIHKVGWIPKAYVERLTVRMADRLRNVRAELRVFEYEAEQLYASAPIDAFKTIIESEGLTSPSSSWDADWRNPNGIRDDVASALSRIARQTAEQDSERLRAEDQRLNPSSPQPPLPTSQSLPRPLGFNKPTPPTPDYTTGERQRSNTSPHASRIREKPSTAKLPLLDSSGSGVPCSPSVSKSNEKIKRVLGPDAVDYMNHKVNQSLSRSLEFDKDGHVKSGTLPALIERLTGDFGGTDHLKAQAMETIFRNTFLMTFRTFTTANELFDLLSEKFRLDPPDSSASDYQLTEWRDKKLFPTQNRVLSVFTDWLDYRLLEEEPHIATRMTQFLLQIKTLPHSHTATLIIKKIERLTFSTPNYLSNTNSKPPKRRRSQGGKVDLLKQDVTAVAEQLCLLEHRLYSKITSQECLEYAKKQTGDEVANLTTFCGTHDKLAAWVKMSILSNDNLTKRANTVDFWIKVAEKCRNMNNFASMSALITALSSTVVNRLHLTWAHSHRKPNLDALLKYNEPTGGFHGYRNLLSHAEGPCVPFIVMYLNDIVHIKDQFSGDTVTTPTSGRSVNHREQVICFTQRQRWYEVISTMLKHQSKPYPTLESESTQRLIHQNMLQASFKDPQWFWSKSQEVQQTELQHADIRRGLEEAGF